MHSLDLQPPFSAEDALRLAELAETILANQDISQLADAFLTELTQLVEAPSAFLYLGVEPLAPAFYQVGLPVARVSAVKDLCEKEFYHLASQTDFQTHAPLASPVESLGEFSLFSLAYQSTPLGLCGLAKREDGTLAHPVLAGKAVAFLEPVLTHCLHRLEYDKQIKHLNIYLTVSSMITQALDLRDVFEAVLYFCMDALDAEAASVLLLDYEKKNFRFYSAEGPAKPILLTASFPADQGLAASVLESQQGEIINDVQSDPRFYGKIDADTGFRTKNMIAIPLIAGKEKVGVLEVLNKVSGGPFLDHELLLLQTLAEEIAFAIRNAKLFEVVVKSYCKMRQGLKTCKGCKRPLGSWTPCVKYREEAGVLE